MGHQPCDPAIAVQKRVNPQKAVMHRADGLNLASSAERPRRIGHVEARHEPRQLGVFGREVTTDIDVTLAPLPGNDPEALAGSWIGDKQHVRGKARAEYFVPPGGVGGRSRLGVRSLVCVD